MLPSKANMFYLDCQFRDIDIIKNDVDENNHEKPNQKWQAMVSGRVRQAMASGCVRQKTKETSVNKNFIICFLYAVI